MNRSKIKTLSILFAVFAVMIAISALVVQFVIMNGMNISVNIESQADENGGEVTISVLNTAGSTLLFYENDEITGKIEYLSDNGWVEYCDVRYTEGNADAVSHQYGGAFAELDPGEDWEVVVPEQAVSRMENGTYRIIMTYITEDNYTEFLEDTYLQKQEEQGHPVFNTSEESDDAAEDTVVQSEHEVFIQTFEFSAPEPVIDKINIDDSVIDGE